MMFTLPPPPWVSIGSIIGVARLKIEWLYKYLRHVRHDFCKRGFRSEFKEVRKARVSFFGFSATVYDGHRCRCTANTRGFTVEEWWSMKDGMGVVERIKKKRVGFF